MKKEQVPTLLFRTLAAIFALLFLTMGSNAEAEPAAFSLIGTIVSKTTAGAVIKDGTGKQTFFRLNEALPDGSTIVRVRDDSVSLKSADGTLYEMFISHEKSAAGLVAPPPAADSPVNINSPSRWNPAAVKSPRRPQRHRHVSEETDE